MTYETYQNLIRDYCATIGNPDVEGMLRRAILRVDRTLLEAVYDEMAGNAYVLMIGYFHALPNGRRDETMEQLLHANFMLQMLGIPLVWTLNPRTDQIIATDRISLSGLDTQTFATRLAYFSQTITKWGKQILQQAPDGSWAPHTKSDASPVANHPTDNKQRSQLLQRLEADLPKNPQEHSKPGAGG